MCQVRNLETWWASLGDVEKASPERISELVQRGEATIRSEQQSWQATAKTKKEPKKKKEE